MINSYDAWGDVEEILFLFGPPSLDTFSEAANYAVPAADYTDEWYETIHLYLWSLRRLFWLELIPAKRIRVRFWHDGERGQGLAPHTLFRAANQPALDDDHASWPEEDSYVLQPAWFHRTDQLYIEWGETLFNWDDVTRLNLFEEDLDSELYEHSFNSCDVITIAPEFARADWGNLDVSVQTRLVENLLEICVTQKEVFQDVLIDPRDLFALVACHPDTRLSLGDFPVLTWALDGKQP